MRHLHELLDDAEGSVAASRMAAALDAPGATLPTAAAAQLAIRHLARRFIVGVDAAAAAPTLARLWRAGAAATVDLLGEATVTESEADRYASRCRKTLLTLAGTAGTWAPNGLLERDGAGPLPRANVSVKVSALTPQLRAEDPARGVAGARERLRRLLRHAREAGAHVHIDMESLDTREATLELTLDLLGEAEFVDGPSCGVVVQAYLVDSGQELESILAWAAAHRRGEPLTIRLVKGAYWDHEVVEAAQHGWTPPVFTDRRACDRNFESLSRRLIDGFPTVRAAIASHNLRSVAHAAAYAEAAGLGRGDVEFQVLRGLGDDLMVAIAATGRRVRCYCPVGDLVSGMAYLVRRLLENTANDSFLAATAGGADLSTLLAAP